MLMLNDPDLAHFVAQVRGVDQPEAVRAVQIDLDAVYDPDRAQQERNLDALIKRIYGLGVNVVLLQAFAERPQRVLTRDQLISLTHGPTAGPFERSIDTLISRLRQKIETDVKNPKLIQTVRSEGYMFTTPVTRS